MFLWGLKISLSILKKVGLACGLVLLVSFARAPPFSGRLLW